jgi:hypothetical protein
VGAVQCAKSHVTCLSDAVVRATKGKQQNSTGTSRCSLHSHTPSSLRPENGSPDLRVGFHPLIIGTALEDCLWAVAATIQIEKLRSMRKVVHEEPSIPLAVKLNKVALDASVDCDRSR